MKHAKESFAKEALLTTVEKIWNHFDEEYYFKSVKPVLERIKAIIKTPGGTTKY